ncbi:MAG TPA: exodeoxyribonuclease VII large subunit [Casimicrobiaceae bacterium]|nr:exodeoxyribonuclease VII large subunit [Casimicrobiaceae bacterium]
MHPDDVGADRRPVLPVSLLVSSARLIIERHLGLAWISGEVSGFTRAASGHCYFVLKDERAQVRCVLYRQKAQLLEVDLRDGLAVEVRAAPTIYEARGEFQLNVDAVRLAGRGALYERFARLKSKLEAAGWFRPERKRPLPAFPGSVGLVTSLRAAALWDVLTTLRRRMPLLLVIVYPAAVHGDAAAAEIVSALAMANARREVDVLIVCRGGGSIEDLQAFNEESVARAVLESAIPVVSGVGHETDFTICDFVADARAPTPTAAAAMVVPDRIALVDRLSSCATRCRRSIEHSLEVEMQRLDLASRRLVHPAARLAAQTQALATLARRLKGSSDTRQLQRESELAAQSRRLARLLRAPLPQAERVARSGERLRRSAGDALAALSQRVASLATGLKHLNPQGVLDRGYSIVTTAAGAIVQDAGQLAIGDAVALRFARGGADAEVTSRRPG